MRASTEDSRLCAEVPEVEGVDPRVWLTGLACSVSLSIAEKRRIWATRHEQGAIQMQELLKIWSDEQHVFEGIGPEHRRELDRLVDKHGDEWEVLHAEFLRDLGGVEDA